jgi:hypothetical protein
MLADVFMLRLESMLRASSGVTPERDSRLESIDPESVPIKDMPRQTDKRGIAQVGPCETEILPSGDLAGQLSLGLRHS